jgi:hypothetical protein
MLGRERPSVELNSPGEAAHKRQPQHSPRHLRSALPENDYPYII